MRWHYTPFVVACVLGMIFLSIVFTYTYAPMHVVFLLLLVGVIVFARPVLGLGVIAVCSALPVLVVPLPGHNLHLIEAAIVLSCVVLPLRGARIWFALPHACALLFFLVACIAFLHVPEFIAIDSPYSAQKRLIVWFLILLCFFSATFLAGYVRRISTVMLMILCACLPVYLIAGMQAFGLNWWPMLEAVGARNIQLTQGRLWGPFPWSVNFGMYLVNPFALALACWLLAATRMQRWLGFLFTVLTLVTLLGTGTRSALLAVGLTTLLAFVLTRRWRTLCITLLSCVVFTLLYGAQLLPLFTHDDSSNSNRWLIWQTALKLIVQNPLSGIGLQQFHHYYGQLIVSRMDMLGAMGVHPHQQYLEWAMEGGIPWLLAGLGLLISLWFCCLRGYRSVVGEDKSIALAALLTLSANMVMGLFDAPLDQLEGCALLFLICGLALGYIRGRQRKVVGHLGESVSGETGISVLQEATTVVRVGDARRTGLSIVLQIISWGIALPLILPMTALLTRYLGPEEYAIYALTFPFLTVFALLSGTGMDPLLIRRLSQQPGSQWSETLSYAAGSRLLGTLLSTALALLVAWLLPVSVEQRNLFLLGSFSLCFSFSFNGLRMIYTLGFRAEQRIFWLAVIETLNRLLTAGLVALVVYWRLPLFWAYALLVYSDLPAFCWLLYLAQKRYKIRLRLAASRFREHMGQGLPVVGHTLLTVIGGQADIFLLSLLVGNWHAGLYALASRVTDPLIALALAYVNGLYPVFCRTIVHDGEQFARFYLESLRVLLLLLVPFALLMTLEAPAIVLIVGGEGFQGATIAMQLLTWTMVITFLNQVHERACMAAQYEYALPVITGTATIITIVLNVLLVPRWTLLGAGLAALLGEGVSCVFLLMLLRQYVHGRGLVMLSLRIGCANAVIPALYLFWPADLAPVLRIFLALVVVLIGYVVLRVLTRADLKRVWAILSVKKRQNEAIARGVITETSHSLRVSATTLHRL